MNAVWHGVEKELQELPGRLPVRLLHQLRHRELAGSINRHEEIELALRGSKLCDVDVKVPASRRCYASPAGQWIG